MTHPPSRSFLLPLALATTILAATAAAQRGEPSLRHTKLTVSMDHGMPPVAGHSLDELPVGQTWRLGSNTASTLTNELPIVSGDVVVAPGHYRVNLLRSGEKAFAFQVDHAAAGTGTGTDAARLIAGWTEANKPNKKLEIEFVQNSKKGPKAEGADPDEPELARFVGVIRFGDNRVDVPFRVVGAGKALRVGNHELRPFQWPTSLASADRPLVLATLVPRRDPGDDAPAFHNVVLVGDRVKLVPAPRAPTEQFGFGAFEAWDGAWASDAEVQWGEPKDEAASTSTVTEAEFDKKAGELVLSFVVGDRIGGANITLPVGPKG